MNRLPHIFEQNKRWAEGLAKEDPDFFKKLSAIQRPEYLWIGCSDSRVPANQITGLLPGEVFVHRNVGNMAGSTDLNMLSVLQFAVEILEVSHVMVVGHYGCGAVRAVWEGRKLGLIDCWLSPLKRLKEDHYAELQLLSGPEEQIDVLCEINVLEQARNVCRTDTAQDAWARGRSLTVHAWIYRLDTGQLKDLGFCADSPADVR